jgi:hypothetical protein
VKDGVLATTPEQRSQATTAHAEARCLVLFLERLLVQLVRLLESEGIDYRILKGPAMAHLVYPEPWLRSYGDIDLLVAAQDFETMIRLLVDLGYVRDRPQPRPGFDRRFGKGVTVFSTDGFPVDLHRTLAEGPFAQRIHQSELFARSSSFFLGGHSVRALGTEENFLHACLHAVLGDAPPRFVPLRDLAQILQTTDLDVERVHRLSSSWKAEAVIARAVCTAWSVFQLTESVPVSDWAHRYQPTRAQELVLGLYPTRDHYAVMALAELRLIPGLRAKASYLRAMMLPDPGYLNARNTGHLQRWRIAAHSIVNWRLHR